MPYPERATRLLVGVGRQVRVARVASGPAAGKIEYVGMAPPGATESEEAWRIVKFTYDDDGALSKCTYPRSSGSHSDAHSFAWSQRASYDYDPDS